MPNSFAGVIRDENPCKKCPDKGKRPACRKGCPKDEAWHKELERVKANQREYERNRNIDYDHFRNGGKQ